MTTVHLKIENWSFYKIKISKTIANTNKHTRVQISIANIFTFEMCAWLNNKHTCTHSDLNLNWILTIDSTTKMQNKTIN